MNQKFDELAKGLAQSITRRQALKRFGVSLAAIALVCFGLTGVQAQTYTTIDLPGAAVTIPAGINLSGQIVGREVDASGTSHGFLLSGSTVTVIDYPGAVWADAVGINDSGHIVGAYSLMDRGGTKGVTGFLLSGGVFTSISFPRAGHTQCRGINSSGDIVGYYSVNNADNFDVNRHGFLLQGGIYSSIDFPGASYTEAWRVNDSGQILGRYIGADGNFHLFLLSNGNFASIDYPGALQTAPGGFSHLGGLNNNGDIVSDYCNSGKCILNTAGEIHGFLLSGGVFTSFDPPGSGGTVAFGINDLGAIVGAYLDSSGAHGFLRTP
jgi:uncharacterized membrane protein